MPAINASGAGMAAQNQPIVDALFNFELAYQSLPGVNLSSEMKKPDPGNRVGLCRQAVGVLLMPCPDWPQLRLPWPLPRRRPGSSS